MIINNKKDKLVPLYYIVSFISSGVQSSITINAFHVTQVSLQSIVVDNGIKVYVGGSILSIDSVTEDEHLILDGKNLSGQNLLGNISMQVRNILRNEYIKI